jgi:hypothetical protein
MEIPMARKQSPAKPAPAPAPAPVATPAPAPVIETLIAPVVPEGAPIDATSGQPAPAAEPVTEAPNVDLGPLVPVIMKVALAGVDFSVSPGGTHFCDAGEAQRLRDADFAEPEAA